MKVSIVTINLNNLKGLQATVASVLGQTYKDLEYIVIDGASTDGSKEFMKGIKDQLYYMSSEPDSGIYSAMNKGIKKSTGDYILFLNSGDTFINTNSIDDAVGYMVNKNIDIYYGDVIRHYPDGRMLEKKYPEVLTVPFFMDSALGHQAVLTRRTLFDALFYFNEDYTILADWDFLMVSICKKGASYKKIPLFLVNYDMQGISSSTNAKKIMKKERLQTYQRHFPEFISLFERIEFLESFFQKHQLYRLKSLSRSPFFSKLHLFALKVLFKIQRFTEGAKSNK